MPNQKTYSTEINISILQARSAMLQFFRPTLNKWGLTEQQWRIVRLLAEEGQQDFHVLAIKACTLRPSLTGILDRLEKMNLVSRRKPATDQRKVLLKLTPKGEKLYKEMYREIDAQYAELEQAFGADKLAELERLLHELKTVSDEYHQSEENSETDTDKE